ncbi:ATPase [Devosia pacifica]|uniref:ATPase n=1 Tax=Devosia pacifica TaxID=1335967 RepID=A0A918VPQ8_9HYPH|nr:ATP12 family protein [Devosia pacifica]GHA12708.1 ATPase [Devosia pacifica]
MRDHLEEALNHRDDGYGRVQRNLRPELPKRFYKEATALPADGGYTVALDNRPTLTPGNRTPVRVPSEDIAAIMAGEWGSQGERIDAETMPMVRLVNSAIESGETSIPALRAEVVKYAASDLLLYRAEHPQELVAEQEQHWDAALVRIARHFEVSFQPTVGILYQEQPATTLEKLDHSLEGAGLLEITALVSITSLTGSGILAIALRHDLLDADSVWNSAHVDEDFQARLWGVDEEAALRRRKRRTEFDAAVRLVEAMRR